MIPPEALLVGLVAVVLFGFLLCERAVDRRYRGVKLRDLYRKAAMKEEE